MTATVRAERQTRVLAARMFRLLSYGLLTLRVFVLVSGSGSDP